MDNTFDDSKIEPAAPEWKVYFEGNFWGHLGRDRAGTEIRLDQQFDWAGHHWVIPAVYSCGKGLVVDLCMRTEAKDIRRFIAKWNLTAENDSEENFTQEQQMQIELENPLGLDFSAQIELNGKTLQSFHGCAVGISPCLPDGAANEKVAQWAAMHYGLDDSYGWTIYRRCYPWAGKRRPEIRSLSLTMKQQPCCVPGPHFRTHAPGDSFSFSHPVSGTEYTLTVQELERQSIPQEQFDSDRWACPTHFTAMSYTLSPDPDDAISIYDCAAGDRPLEITPCTDRYAPEAQNDIACTVVIGSAGSPAVTVFGKNTQESLHAVCSALHFEPAAEDIEWRVVFHVVSFPNETFLLI